MSDRKRRVNEAIKQVLSDTIPTLKDPRIGFVTVTGVEATKDFQHATVYVSVLGPERERERTLEGLDGGARRAPGAASGASCVFAGRPFSRLPTIRASSAACA